MFFRQKVSREKFERVLRQYLPPNESMVQTRNGVFTQYVENGVDQVKCNAISDSLFQLLIQTLKKEDGSFRIDEAMVTIAMVFRKIAMVVLSDETHRNKKLDYSTDIFPEIVGLLHPGSGMAVVARSPEIRDVIEGDKYVQGGESPSVEQKKDDGDEPLIVVP